MSNVLTKEYFEKHLDQKFKVEFAKRDKLFDKRFAKQSKDFKSYVKLALKSNREEFMNYLRVSLKSNREEFQNYVGVVREDFQYHLKMLAENVTGLHQKFDKLDGRVENLETDMRYIKATLAVAEII